MFLCPRAINCDTVGKHSTERVSLHQYEVVELFDRSQDCIIRNFIVELVDIDLLQHITTDSWIMRIANYFAAKKNFDEWIGKSNTYGIDEYITW